MTSEQQAISAREANSLQRSIDNLTTAINKLDETVEATYVRKDVLEPTLKQITDTLGKHSSYWDWLIKIVIGAVLLALLGLVLTQK